jgi:hypothetical protein
VSDVSVQRSFTTKLSGLADSSYEDGLCPLGAESLELKRVRLDPILGYKVFGLIDINVESYFLFANSGHDTTGYKLLVHQCPEILLTAHCTHVEQSRCQNGRQLL